MIACTHLDQIRFKVRAELDRYSEADTFAAAQAPRQALTNQSR